MSVEALVVLSGGQDSTTCLYWALNEFGAGRVASITFDYGQRHRIEIECARTVAKRAGVDNTVLPIDTFSALGGASLTDDRIDIETSDAAEALPNTFVPGRNLIFMTFAAAYAYQRDIDRLVTGVAQTDYSGYPDCRQDTITALANAINLGMEGRFRIHTPLMNLSKAETVLLARDVGALPAMVDTHTCYQGMRPPCGECQACTLRAKGFAEAGIADPLVEAAARGDLA
ncbi:MAG: 7-cyano-7-deazaguanine synthase QueC [Pseudomonadota bacterium]